MILLWYCIYSCHCFSFVLDCLGVMVLWILRFLTWCVYWLLCLRWAGWFERGVFAAWICCVLLVDWCCAAVGWLVVGGLVVCYFLGC